MEDPNFEAQAKAEAAKHNGRGVIVRGDPGMVVRFAHCCSPVPGDEILGYITRGRGVSVHRSDCPNVASLLTDFERIIDVEWVGDQASSSYTVNIQVTAEDRPGVVMDLSQLLVSMNINIITMNAKTDRNRIVWVKLSFEVNSTAQLNTVMKGFKKIRSVTGAYRTNV